MRTISKRLLFGLLLLSLVALLACGRAPATTSTTTAATGLTTTSVPPTTTTLPPTTSSTLPTTTLPTTTAPTTTTAPPTSTSVPPTTTTSVPPASTTAPPTSTPPASTGAAVIAVAASGLNPATLTVPVGTTVTWNNTDQEDHTLVSDTPGFTGAAIPASGNFEFTFNTAGTYNYHLGDDPAVKGTIVVT